MESIDVKVLYLSIKMCAHQSIIANVNWGCWKMWWFMEGCIANISGNFLTWFTCSKRYLDTYYAIAAKPFLLHNLAYTCIPADITLIDLISKAHNVPANIPQSTIRDLYIYQNMFYFAPSE